MDSGKKRQDKCQICQSYFNSSGPEPYLLPCLHSVCSTCLKADTTEELTCSTCQETFDKGKGKTDFPKDAVRAKNIILSSVQKGFSATLCSNRQDGNKAKSWCLECEAFLCMVCEEFHKAVKVSRKHVVMSLATFIESGEGLSTTAVHCTDHDNHPLELFDETCNKLLCYKCLKKGHSQCDVEDMNTTIEKFKESQLKEGTERLTKKLGDLAEVESNVRSLSSRLDSKIKEVRKSVQETFSDIRTTIMQREEQILLQLEPCFKAVRDSNSKRLAILDHEKSRCKTVVDFQEKCIELSAPVDLLKMKKMIESRTETCVEIGLPKVREQEAYIHFREADVQDLKEFISTFGEYCTSISDPTSDQLPSVGRITSLKSLNSNYKEKIDDLERKINICAQKFQKIPRLIEESRNSGTIKLTADIEDEEFDDWSDTIFIMNIPCYEPHVYKRHRPWLPSARFFEGVYTLCHVEEARNAKNSWKRIPSPMQTLRFNHQESLELRNPKNSYTKDGEHEIEIEVEITVKNTTGISGLHELIKQEYSLSEHKVAA